MVESSCTSEARPRTVNLRKAGNAGTDELIARCQPCYFFLPSLSVPLIFLPPAVHVQDGTDGAGGFGVSLSTVLAKRISGYEREFHHHRKEIAHVIIAQNYPPTKKRSCRTYPESGAGTVEYVIVLIVAVVIGAGLLGFGTKIAQQVNETGDTIGGWFGSGEDVFGAGSADQAETAFAVYSADDNSLDFYKRAEVPEVGDKFEFKTVTEVYTGFETGTYTLVETPTDRYGSSNAPWAAHQSQIETVTVVDTGIAPESVSVWFANMTNLKTVDVAKIDTSECRQMFDAFFRARKLKSLDLSSWDVSKTLNFSCMFQECHSLESINMKDWSVHASRSGMFGMFFDCLSLQSLDLSGFDFTSVVSANKMFGNCQSLSKVSLGSNWKWVIYDDGEGTNSYLPTPFSKYISGADGKWYSISTGKGYAPQDIPNNTADTYVASKSLLSK